MRCSHVGESAPENAKCEGCVDEYAHEGYDRMREDKDGI